MGLATRVTMRVVVTIPFIVTLSLASELERLPLSGTLTSTLLWRGTSVLESTRLSARWKGSDDSSQMDDFAHVQMEMQASIDSQNNMMHDLFGHFGINRNA
jgi:hypothetical protein